MGDPESSSLNGSKETYKLDDETTAVLQYQDGKLEYGYIIDSGSGRNESVTEDNAVQDDAPEIIISHQEAREAVHQDLLLLPTLMITARQMKPHKIQPQNNQTRR